MGTERGGCSRLMKTPRHNGGAVHSRSMRTKKKDNHCTVSVLNGERFEFDDLIRTPMRNLQEFLEDGYIRKRCQNVTQKH